MPTLTHSVDTDRFARCIEASKRVRWDIDKDVIRGRSLDFTKKFLPDGLSLVNDLDFLTAGERRYLGQIQGRTYANIFGLVERFINAKVLELSHDHWFGDQVALESLVRFSEEEIKHQELFRRVEALAAAEMPAGYACVVDPNDVAHVVLDKSTWAVLALTYHIELFTQLHYKQSIDPDPELSELFKDVFLFHWKEESQHAIMDRLEWGRIDSTLTREERDAAVTDLIHLVAAVDGILEVQSAADAEYFATTCGRSLAESEQAGVKALVLKAYRWQYIVSGIQGRFHDELMAMVDDRQAQRIGEAMGPLLVQAG